MIKLRYIAILLICAVLWNIDAYANKERTINLTNFSEKDYKKYLFPHFPSYGYIFNINYFHTNNILNPTVGTMNFFKGQINDKDFFRLNSNAFDKYGTPFVMDWNISTGFFFNNRKKAASKFTTEMIFDSQDDDINTVFTKRLLKNNITNLNPLYTANNEIEGYKFDYVVQRSQTYLAVRTSAQILLAVGVGVANYYAMKYTNMDDWKYGWTWADAKSKVKDGWHWDPNDFNTNTIFHLYAGATYYMIARSNYYSIPASFLWSFGGSFMWEFFGEWREQVSLNDMIFTPALGALTGEAFIYAGNFIERNMRPSFFRETMLVILNPFGYFNKKLDSANSGNMRVQVLFVSPVQTAVERRARDVFNR